MTTMLTRAVLLTGLAAVLSACPKKNDMTDGGPDAAVDAAVAVVDAGAPADPTAGATNASEVGRFPDEVTANAAAVSVDATEKVHTSPGTGALVATLSKGTSVTEVSTHGTYALIVFPDPKNASSNLLGWIPESAFGPAHAATHNNNNNNNVTTTCPAGENAIVGAKANFCAQICIADKDCKPNQQCKGPYDAEGNKGGAQVNICVAASGPAPTPAPTTPTPTPTAPPASQPAYIVNPGAGNSCASGYSYMSDDKKCHKSCSTGIAACNDPRAFCVNHLGAKVCWATRI